MRPTLLVPALALAPALVPFAAFAESGMCEYRHPAHPGWDFFASCSYTEMVTAEARRREVVVSNGSKFSTVSGASGESVNGLAARELDRDDASCWRTEAEAELICIYPADTIRPADPPALSGDTFAAVPTAAAPGSTFGGGTKGFCLLVEGGALVEQGACVKRENCLEMETGGGMSCLTSYDWASGRVSEVATTPDWVTLDGAPAIKGDPGCLVDTGAGVTFCHSAKAMTAKTHPILGQVAAAPAPAEADAPEGESAVPATAAE